MRRFDLLIIGAGSGNSIIGPEHDDWDVAIVERGLFGGTCLNVGCIPSKMFVYAAEVAHHAAHTGPRLGVDTSFDGVDWPAIRDRVFGRIDPIAEGGLEYRQSLPNVTVYRENAVFVGPKEVMVGEEVITADRIVIAAGARPMVPPGHGLVEAGAHTSDTIMRLDRVPERLAVLGAGYIAAELGSVFAAFGSEVTFLMRSECFLRNEDEEISTRFTEAYRARYRLHCGVTSASMQREGDEVVFSLTDEDGPCEVRADEVLVAVGRTPNSDQLKLAEHGYRVDDNGYLVTDEQRRTGIDGVWALGDITNPIQLKHVANYEAKVVAHNISNPENSRSVDDRLIPHAVFGHPQVASVGLTERECIARDRPYIAHTQDYGSAAYGWAMEDTDSVVKLIADPESRLLLGAHILGPQASTLIQQLIQGMTFGQTVDEMATGQYYIHPGLPEVVEQALLEL